MRFKTTHRVLALLLLTAATADAGTKIPSTADPRKAVQATLVDFYRWYVHAVSKLDDPMREDRKTMEGYVSKSLIRKITKMENSPDGLEVDYFTESQDILDDWPEHIAVSDLKVSGTAGSAVVTLGATKASRWRLDVNVVSEGGAWRIAEVRSEK